MSPVAGRDSFGSLSPISKSIYSPAPLRHSAKSERLCLSTSSIFQSTPERLSSGCQPTSSANLVNMSVDNGSTIDSLKCRLISTELPDRHNDDDAGAYIYIVDAATSFDSSASDEQMSHHFGSQEHATTPIRKNRFPNRKNLSQSFLCGDDSCEDEIMADVRPISPAPTMNNKGDFGNGATESGTLCRTDSGFNEMEDSKNKQRNNDITEQMISNLQYINGTGTAALGDISMMMTDA